MFAISAGAPVAIANEITKRFLANDKTKRVCSA